MPWRPRQVEKVMYQMASPTTVGPPGPSTSTTWQDTRGCGLKKAAPKSSGVAFTASGSRSYSASSRTKASIRPTSAGRAARTRQAVAREDPTGGVAGGPAGGGAADGGPAVGGAADG